MAYAIGATPELGRNTFALLTKCSVCGKPYDGSDGWHTRHVATKRNDHWWIVCSDCERKGER